MRRCACSGAAVPTETADEGRGATNAGGGAILGGVFLGDDLLAWLTLALGGALLVGNVAAIVRPPAEPKEEGALERAPLARSVVMAAIGLVAAVWALASLIAG